MKKLAHAALQVFRLLPLLLMAACALWLLLGDVDISFDTLLRLAPEDRFKAVWFLWMAFAFKSMSVMLPVMLLFALSGYLFPLPIALAANAVGTAITLTLPYLVGRFSGPDLTERLAKKHPRLEELRALRNRDGLFLSFIARAVGILPCDVVSLYMGNTRMPYPQYLAGGILGFLPDLVCATVVGMKITEPASPWFWLGIGVNLTLCAAALLYYRAYLRRHRGSV